MVVGGGLGNEVDDLAGAGGEVDEARPPGRLRGPPGGGVEKGLEFDVEFGQCPLGFVGGRLDELLPEALDTLTVGVGGILVVGGFALLFAVLDGLGGLGDTPQFVDLLAEVGHLVVQVLDGGGLGGVVTVKALHLRQVDRPAFDAGLGEDRAELVALGLEAPLDVGEGRKGNGHVAPYMERET